MEEAYDAEALRARQREDTLRQDTLRQDTLRQDTLRQATVKLLSNNSQSHLAESQSAEPCLRLRWRWEESLGGGVGRSMVTGLILLSLIEFCLLLSASP